MFTGDEPSSQGSVPSGAMAQHVDDWEGLALDYLDGRLDPESRAAIEGHLSSCPECSARLQVQQQVATSLGQTPLDDPPPQMEERILGELGIAVEARLPARGVPVEEPSRWSGIWGKRVRPWIPATVAVAAVFLAIVTYGLLRSDVSDTEEAALTTAAPTAVASEGGSTREETLGLETTTLGSAVVADSAVTTASTTDTAGETAPTATTATMIASATQDREAMINSLESAQSPVYIAFEASAPIDTESPDESSTTLSDQSADTTPEATLSPQQVQEIAAQISTHTTLEPLDSSLSLDGPTFAAYVPRNDAEKLVDLLRSIAAPALALSLDTAVPTKRADFEERLIARKREYPELSAQRVPQPAVLDWSFTTSTLVPATDGETTKPQVVMPDEAGTHVLVVIFIRR